jgi:hypothetical protein
VEHRKREEIEAKDIFISYRRQGGFDPAHAIFSYLDRQGYTCFFDLDTLRSGEFDKKIFRSIGMCKDFLVVLTPGSLDDANDANNTPSWMHQEVAFALKSEKNIIPIFVQGFSFPSTLPEDLRKLKDITGTTKGEIDAFEGSMLNLRNKFLLSKPKPSVARLVTIVLAIVLAIVLVIALVLFLRHIPQSGGTPEVTPAPSPSPTIMPTTPPTVVPLTAEERELLAAYQPTDRDTPSQLLTKAIMLYAADLQDVANQCLDAFAAKAQENLGDPLLSSVAAARIEAALRAFFARAASGEEISGLLVWHDAKAPLQTGDIVLTVNGNACRTLDDWSASLQSDTPLSVVYWRLNQSDTLAERSDALPTADLAGIGLLPLLPE